MDLKNNTPSSAAYDIEVIQRKVANDVINERNIHSISDLEVFLTKWWCRHYNKPYKCTEIKEYTLEELIYEYFDILFHNNNGVLEKYLSKESDSVNTEDEEWFKKQMGNQYIPKETQQKILAEAKEELVEEDVNMKFEEFI